MKIVVIGGSGLIGSKLTQKLLEQAHHVVSASPTSGVNILTGEGLDAALHGASVVVDVSNSPSFEDEAVLKFFQTSSRVLLDAEAAAGVGHHVALSVVGAERLTENGYFRAKVAQERLVAASSGPYSIVRATQFFEFIDGIADAAIEGDTVRLAPVLIQPMAADDVATALGRVAVGPPLNRTTEVAGPEPFRLDELVRAKFAASGVARLVVADPHAPYFGWVTLEERTLMPGENAELGTTRFEDWLKRDVIANEPTTPE
jgi:uncharacterized protein YbjT (DUF2867 family)